MNNKIFLSVIGALLVIAFFIPWISAYGFSVNAWDIVFKGDGPIRNPVSFILILIPITGLLICFCESLNEGNYPINKRLTFTFPLQSIAYFFIGLFYKINEMSGGRMDIQSFFKGFEGMNGIGFWITLISSIVLIISAISSGPKKNEVDN